MTESAFIQDLAMLMAVAGLVSVLFSKFKWPKVIGYILAGVVLSRHTWGSSLLVDEGSIQTIGQLGIIFLMFILGLEFSTSSMKKIKDVALPAALFDTIVMTWLGYTVGTRFLGWEAVPSLFLGAAICDSSTTLLAKILDEMKWSKRPFVKYVIGTSVCEDIVTVGIIALITGVATGRGMSVGEVGLSMGGLAVFMLATLTFGLVLVPRLLNSVAKHHDDEELILTLLGCCFFVTFLAFKLDYSLAMGAFLVGIFGASCDVRERIKRLVEPFRSMFAAVFFVTIGLLVDYRACLDNYLPILVLSFVVMVGKLVNITIASLASGSEIKNAVQTGFSLAQIGEFAYMVALLYVTITGDSSSPMYQIVVGVSLLTTVMNPVMIRISEPISDFLETKSPEKFRSFISTYHSALERLHELRRPKGIRKVVRRSIVELVLIFIMNLSVAVASTMLVAIDFSKFSKLFEKWDSILFCFAANVFFLALLAPTVKIARLLGKAFGDVLFGSGSEAWRLAAKQISIHAVIVITVVLYFLQIFMLNVNLAPQSPIAKAIMSTLMLVILAFGWRLFVKATHRATLRLNEALSTDERLAAKPKELNFSVPEGTIHKLTLGDTSPAVGGTVVTLNIRAKTGASIVAVHREDKIIRNIGPEFEFRIGDILVAIGQGHQIAALKDLLGVI
ncbi:MAG: cation:proton antiporter [Kiritimatiellae bacterium]|nr:cation:proton antiporter [Kiritimatiellia bacterium]